MPRIKRLTSLLALALSVAALLGCESKQKEPDRPAGITRADSIAYMERQAALGDTSAIVWLAETYVLREGVVRDTARTLGMLREAAGKGCLRAMLLLGDAYRDPDHKLFSFAEEDHATGMSWYRAAAAHGYAYALQRLGRMYMVNDRGVAANYDSVWFYLEPAMANGSARAFYFAGAMVDRKSTWPSVKSMDNDSLAVSWHRQGERLGCGDAAYRMGIIYYFGQLGLKKDYSAALALFKKAVVLRAPNANNPIGIMHRDGKGVPADAAIAASYWRTGAMAGDAGCQWNFGWSYDHGKGVPTDKVLAYAWYNLALSSEENGADRRKLENNLANLRVLLSKTDVSLAESLSSSWRTGQDIVRPGFESANSSGSSTPSSSGTAFALTSDGLALTNFHVVDGANEIRVAGREGLVTVVAVDRTNDLALIKLPFKPDAVATFSPEGTKPQLGGDIVVFGFPLNSMLSSSGNVTTGSLSALTGFGNSASHIQISAAVQPGSSGSPVYDRAGRVIGVVVQRINDRAMLDMTGGVGQSVNFAVNRQTIGAFLDASGVRYRQAWAWPTLDKSTARITEDARKSVYCLEVR
jgi:uncharacterized protein